MSSDTAEHRPNHKPHVEQKQKANAKRQVMTQAHLVTDGEETERIIRVQQHDNGQIYVDGYSPDGSQSTKA